MSTKSGTISVNVLVPVALVKRLDAAVAAERETALAGRVSRSSIVRDALLARLAATVPAARSRSRATVAPAGARAV